MTRSINLFLVATAIFLAQGCANEPAAPANGLAAVAVAVEQQQENVAPQEEQGGFGKKLGDLVEQAKSKAPSIEGMKKMFGDAGDATGKSADDAMKWATAMFKSASENGQTTSNNVSEWISEDWNNINAWEYQIVSVDSKQITSDPTIVQKKLNEAGKKRWECFHVSDIAGGMIFYFKRQRKSYMKSLPLKDMLKLVPLLDSEQ